MSRSIVNIDDWSVEGRCMLLREHETTIRLLLEEAFMAFYDDHGLASFGFGGDDPVGEAVQWCLLRWAAEKPIDPMKLKPWSRSFRLFTQPRWWLAQKVTTQGLRARLVPQERLYDLSSDGRAEFKRGLDGDGESVTASEGVAIGLALGGAHAAAVDAEVEALATTLRTLLLRTCDDLVVYWLDATERTRSEFLNWNDSASIPDGVRDDRASRYRFDATFRFEALRRDLIRDPVRPALRAMVETTFTRCNNEPPYRVPDRVVAPLMAGFGCKGPRDVTQWRKDGARTLLEMLVDAYERMTAEISTVASGSVRTEPFQEHVEELRAGIRVLFLRRALQPTVLYSLGIESERTLAGRLNSVGAVVGGAA